jgi:hypothetical protein
MMDGICVSRRCNPAERVALASQIANKPTLNAELANVFTIRSTLTGIMNLPRLLSGRILKARSAPMPRHKHGMVPIL